MTINDIMQRDIQETEREERERAERLKALLESLEKKVEQIEPERLTGHPVLDTIFWEKKQ